MRFRLTAMINADFDCTSMDCALDSFKETMSNGLTRDDFYNIAMDKVTVINAPRRFKVTLRWEKAYNVETSSEEAAENEACNRADEDDAEVRMVSQSSRTTLITEETN